jgi:BON domain
LIQIQALASVVVTAKTPSGKTRSIREELLSRLKEQSWTDFGGGNVIVKEGEVHLWGLVGSEDERRALLVLAESIPGVTKVVDETIHLVRADAEPADHSGEDRGDLLGTAATVAVVGVGAAAFEAALLPGIVLGAAAAWLPRYFPSIGEALDPLFRSTVRGAYKLGQKTREMTAA